MSLRPERGRSHAGGSHSRSRDDHESSHGAVRFDGDGEPSKKSGKAKKSARFADVEEDEEPQGVTMPAMPEATDGSPERPHATEVHRPSKLRKAKSSSEESEGDDDFSSKHQPSLRDHRESEVHSPPAKDLPRGKPHRRISDDLAYGDHSHGKVPPAVPYPEGDAFGLQYPDEDGPASPRMRMPSITGWQGYANTEPFQYEKVEPYKYAEPPDKISYKPKPSHKEYWHTDESTPKKEYRHFAEPTSTKEYRHTEDPVHPHPPARSVSFPQEYSMREVRPREEREERDGHRSNRSNRLSVDDPASHKRGLSPARRMTSGMDRLSVSTGHADVHHAKAGAPPASPLLESYHGTYQSISPMPSPIMLPQNEDHEDGHSSDSISEEDLDRDDSRRLSSARSKMQAKAKKKRVKLYDAEGDAEKIAEALNHHDARPGPLIEILPELTHDQLLALRGEYKKQVKIQGRGVNLAKQIKATTSGNFNKVCYATALGRWESEAYWANFWYQAHSSSRELLIEALMGRSNADIREIKEGFRDKRYHDDLALCMQKELKPDKFRTAVLMALEGDRQEETDVWPPEERSKDVERLHRALTSREGGETAILEIVVLRSNNHLRNVLKAFEKAHKENLAKAALKKSGNLVGEVIAHILNGVINRPARDCLILRHAINDVTSKEGDLRYELLMSRLIRLHWDRSHLSKVKDDYKSKYGESLERSVKKATKGDFGAFCVRLCETQ